jgi:FKBP-type peptidyl-prolyl cis-trans isomerase 2
MIINGSTVQVHYTGKLKDGEVFDSSEGKEPLQFQVGGGNIINGFETAIMGKTPGDKVNVTIPVEEAYGPVREDLFVQVPLDKLPGEVEVGQILHADAGNGQTPVQVRVKEVNQDHIVIDGNHPLAGMELTFDIEIVDVQ